MANRDDRTGDEALAAEALERFRQTGIRLDREGRFWHEGGEIEHQGMRRALRSWIDVLDDGRPILRLDERRFVYIEVDDATLLVVTARWDGDRAYITANDEVERELAYDSLRAAADDALYCRIVNRWSRALTARVLTQAYYVLAERIVELEGGFALRAAGGLHPIATAEAA